MSDTQEKVKKRNVNKNNTVSEYDQLNTSEAIPDADSGEMELTDRQIK